ncbi:hypothetical protein PIB30_009839 [Stylosanthes scabra]|uniref:Uncharacterized protein n=1 Tax=Stylosanthes scabra TaxID=79078 RepID=A0ABU6Q668_9FABA|nr:hypothetical protein [Stylosanthes scabra]
MIPGSRDGNVPGYSIGALGSAHFKLDSLRVIYQIDQRDMGHVGDKRGRDVDHKLKDTVSITSSDESDDDDDDSDSIVYVPSPRKPTKQEIFEYYEHCNISKGFDVPEETGGLIHGGIAPFLMDETREQLVTDLAKQALQVYNEQNVLSNVLHYFYRTLW